MENMFILKKAARSIALASVIIFSAAGVAHAAGVGDQVGDYGDMSGHGGPVDKKTGSKAGQPSTGPGSTAPSDQGKYREKPGNSTSGQGTPGQGDSPYDKPSTGQGAGSQGGGSSGQSGGGGY
jgi:hypothetical protein